jgi:hypothetical protein
VEPGEAVEDEVECELELGVVVAPAEGAAVGDREGHLHDVGMAGAERAGEGGGRLRLEVAGIVEQGLGEPEQAAAEDVQAGRGGRGGAARTVRPVTVASRTGARAKLRKAASSGGTGTSCWSFRPLSRQPHLEAAAVTGVDDAHLALVRLDDSAHDRQS